MKIGILNLLTIIFVIAKLVGYINWSWWLVFTPTILSAFLGILILTLALFVVAKSER